jgi:hypothetical protein
MLGKWKNCDTNSILDFFNFGSIMSIRSRVAVGSSVSVFSHSRSYAKQSVLDKFVLASSLSVRNAQKCGSALSLIRNFISDEKRVSILLQTCLGSAVSVRGDGGLVRLG